MSTTPEEKVFQDVQLHVDFTQASTRSNISSYDPTAAEPENISTAFGKLSKWYEALVPTGGSSGQILGWNSSGTAKWINNTHSLSIAAAASGDTSSISLSPNTKYKLTAGGSDFIFTSPNHVTVTKSADTTSTASPAHGGTFTTVDSVTRDSWGHVTKINTKTVTLPAQYSHPTYTRSDTTSTTSPAHGGTFTVIDSVTATNGHVTAVNVKTVTLPSDQNTDTKVTQTAVGDTYTNFRPLVISASNSSTKPPTASTVTDGTFITSGIFCQPSASTIYAAYYKTTATARGYFLIDSSSNEYPGIYDNGSNLWIGSLAGQSKHHIGATYISAGHNGTAGYSTIYVAVPNAANNDSTSYPVLHGNNYADYTVKKDGTGASGTWGINITGNATKTGIRWNAVSQGQKWSRLYYSETAVNVEGSNGILSISCTRGNVVVNAVFLVFVSHSGSNASHIIELASTNYSTIRCRVVSNSGGSYYFEIYDTANNIASGTSQTWHCCFVTLTNATLTTYTAFTDGSTIPSNFAAANDFTTTVGKASAAIKDISRSGTTFTATRQDGSTFTFTQQDSNTTYSADDGVGLTGTTFYNSGVRSTTINGNYLRVNTNGTNNDLTIPYATKASLLTYTHTNEINFSGGNQSTCYFNYRNADTDAAAAIDSINYKFCNYSNDTSKTTITAATFAGNATTATTASKLGSSTLGSVRRPIYLDTGTATVANYMVSHFGNAGKSNMNDVGKMFASVGMTNLSDPGNAVDNPMNGTTKSTSWHLYWDACYSDDPSGSNGWVAQIANKAGTAQWWVRSRQGGTITNGTEWAAGWKHLVVSPQAGQGGTITPIYIDANGHTQSCSYTIEASVPSGAVFTDHITTATSSGSGNAVTAISADANGALTVTKGSTFSTSDHKHGLLHSNLSQSASDVTTDAWATVGIDPAVNGYVLKSIRYNTNVPPWGPPAYGAGIAFGGSDTKGIINIGYASPNITFVGGSHSSSKTAPTWYIKISGTSGNTYNLANFYDTTTSRTANTVLAAPNGSAGGATFRKLVAADIPTLNYIGAKSDGTYYGMASPAGADNVWIRTTSQGIIPYQGGNAGSGHSYLGTSSWYFSHAYIDTVHGSLDGTAAQAVKLRSAAARTDSTVDTADTTPYQKYWVKIASCYTTQTYADLESLWAVNDVYGNRQGILKIRARVDGTAGTFGATRTIRWLVADSSVDVNRFAIVCYNNRKPDGTEATGYATIEFWWKSTAQYASFSFVLLDETRRLSKSPNDWTLYDTSTYGQAALPTTGNITYSVGVTILNSTTGNAATATTATTATKATQDGDGNTISSTYLKLSGGTMTGTLTAKASQYADEYGGALNMNNSNIYGVNSIYTADASDNAAEGIHFYRDSTHVDTLWMNGGSLLFVPNRELGTSTTAANSQKVARFTANPTTGQVVITDGTTGGVKSSGYTIATSVPSGAVFTDTKNTAGSTDTSSKIFLIGATSQAANPQTYSDDQCYVTSGTLQTNITSATAGVNANTANSSTAGGLSLYSTNPDQYGIIFRGTSQKGKHGYVQDDCATYFTMTENTSSSTWRGWIFRDSTSGSVTSIDGRGNAVFNGSVTVGGNGANTSGCRLTYNSSTQSLDFIFA